MSSPIVDEVAVAIKFDTSRSLAALREATDGSLARVQADFREAFGSIERGADTAGGEIGRDIDRGTDVARASVRSLESQATRSFEHISREASEAGAGIAGKLGGALKGIAALGVGTAVAGGLTLLGVMGLKTAASLEQTEVAFSSLLGSMERGKQTLQELTKFAATTPFQLTEITGAAQRFLAFNDAVGIADDQLIPFLTTLGDIASVTAAGAEGVDRVTLALGQIASRGKVSLEDLQQIQEALPGFSSVAAIAAQTGMTTAETLDAISAGSINADVGIQALLDGMKEFPGAAGAMEAQSKTLLGVFSTFQDTVGQALASGFAPVIPEIKNSLNEITPLIGNAASQLAPALGKGLSGILQGIGPLIEPLAGILTTVLDAAMPLVNLLAKLALPIFEALEPVIAALEPVLASLTEPLLELVVALTPIFPALGSILIAVVSVIAPIAKLLGLLISFLASKAIAPLVEFLAIGFMQLAQAIGAFGEWLSRIDWGAVWDAISGFFSSVGSAIGDFFGGIVDWFQSLPGKAADAFGALRDAAVNRILALVDFVRSIPSKIAAALAGLGSLLVEKGKDLIRGLWQGIKDTGAWLMDKIKGFANDFVIGPIKSVFGISSPSKVMEEEVGRELPAGIEVGIRGGVGQLRDMINDLLTPQSFTRGDGAGSGAGIFVAAGAIVINFNGPVSETEARAAGEAAGDGVLRALERRNVRTTARMA